MRGFSSSPCSDAPSLRSFSASYATRRAHSSFEIDALILPPCEEEEEGDEAEEVEEEEGDGDKAEALLLFLVRAPSASRDGDFHDGGRGIVSLLISYFFWRFVLCRRDCLISVSAREGTEKKKRCKRSKARKRRQKEQKEAKVTDATLASFSLLDEKRNEAFFLLVFVSFIFI